MAKNIGTIAATFRLDTKEARKGMAGINTITGKLSGSLQGLAGRFGVVGQALSSIGPAGIAAAATLGAITVAAAATFKALQKASGIAAQYADMLDNMSTKTSLSTGFLQVLEEAAKDAGESLAGISTAALLLQKNIVLGTSDSKKAVALLGLSFEELKTQAPDEQFESVLAALDSMPPGADKSAAAMGLLGRSGAAMIGVAKNLDTARDRVDSLGVSLTEKGVKSSDAFERSTANLDLAIEGFWKQLGVAVNESGELNRVLDEMADAVANVNKFIRDNPELVTDAVSQAVRWSKAIAGITVQVIKLMSWLTKLSFVKSLPIIGPAFTLGQGIGSASAGEAPATPQVDLSTVPAFSDLAGLQAPPPPPPPPSAPPPGGVAPSVPIGLGGLIEVPEFQIDIGDSVIDIEKVSTAAQMLEVKLAFAAEKGEILEARLSEIEPPEAFEPEGISSAEAFNSIMINLTQTMQQFGIDSSSALGQLLIGLSGMSAAIPGILDFEKSILGSAKSITEGITQATGAVVQGIASILEATGSGSTGARAAKGAAAGAAAGGQVGGPIGAVIGAAIGALTGFFRGRAIDKFEDTVEKEVGFRMTRALAEAVKKTGQPWQNFLTEMFTEGIAAGTATIGGFVEEVADIFSAMEFGALTSKEGLDALGAAMPFLMENLGNLGEVGEEQLLRLIDAAENAGGEFAEMAAQIQAAVDAANRLPNTVEEIAESLNLSVEEARALAEILGQEVETNLERAAREAGLTVKEFNALREAAKEFADINKDGVVSLEEMAIFLAQTNQSAAEVAKAFGVEVNPQVESAAEEAQEMEDRVGGAADNARRLAEELQKAAQAAKSITFPGGPPSEPPTAHGVVTTGPQRRLIGEAGPEVVAPVAALFGRLGDSIASKVGGGGSAELQNIERLLAAMPAMIGRSVRDNIQKAV